MVKLDCAVLRNVLDGCGGTLGGHMTMKNDELVNPLEKTGGVAFALSGSPGADPTRRSFSHS